MALVDTNSLLKVGNALIDNDHLAFIDLLNQLDSASNSEFSQLFQQLYEHTEQHFEHENQLMAQFAFPAETEHNGEHQRVLAEFKQFKPRIDKGMVTFGRAFIKERLPQWFQLHVATMDAALATHIRTKQTSPTE